MNIQTPLQAYLSQTHTGNSHWWTWFCGLWFAIVFFFYAQIIISVIMFGVGGLVAPDAISAIFAAQEPANTNINAMLISMLIGVSPLLPVLFWVLRENIQGQTTKNILIGISAVVMAVTTFGLVHLMMNQPGDSAALTGQLIAAHPVLYGFILLTFPPLAIGLWLTQKFIHKRTILSLHTAAKKFRWKRLFFTVCIFWCVAASVSLILHITGVSSAKLVFSPSKFFSYALVTILFIPLQSATEEILFRGYLNQGLGRFIKNPWAVFIITSAAFAALHMGNPEVTNSAGETHILIAMSGYFIFGMFACLLTLIDGGLESAIGMHAANNMFAAMIVGYDNSALPTPTVFRTGQNTGLDGIIILITLALVFVILYKTRKHFAQVND